MDFDKDVHFLLAAELVVPVPQVFFFFSGILIFALREREKRKARKKCWHTESFARVIYTVLTKSCVTLSHLQKQSPWEKRKKATIKTVKLICSSVMQLAATVPKRARK